MSALPPTIGNRDPPPPFTPLPGNVKPGAFFQQLAKVNVTRDYTIIVDASGSMWKAGSIPGHTRWDDAREALAHLIVPACECDPDGITLYFFGSEFVKHENVSSPEQIRQLFEQQEALGSTDLASVLQDAVMPDKESRPETILVITDGEPDDAAAAARVIVNATKHLAKDEDLSISFIQVGNDVGATRFLKSLDDSLQSQGAKFDVVDTLTCTEMGQMKFADIITAAVRG